MPPSPTPWSTSVLILIGLILIPLAAWVEDKNNNVWQNRLFNPDYKNEINRHTPRITDGTYLPSVITTSTTFTTDDSPLILTSPLHIPQNVSITIEPGVKILAHEFAVITVDGTLDVLGTLENPVTFTTNELHPENKNWGGLIINRDGQASLRHTLLEYASPALTCEPSSSAIADHLHTRFGLVGLYTESENCSLTNSRIQAIHYGVISRGVEPSVANTTITASKQDMIKF